MTAVVCGAIIIGNLLLLKAKKDSSRQYSFFREPGELKTGKAILLKVGLELSG